MGTLRTGDSYEERFGFHARGSINLRNKKEPILVAAVVAVTVALWVVAYIYVVLPQASPLLALAALAMVSVAFFCVGGGAVRVVLAGEKFLYEADEKEFRIYKEKGGNKVLVETFYFIDVVGVKYQKMVPFRGFLVTVSTKYRKYKYQYLFRGAKSTRNAENCPFNILEQRKGAAGSNASE
ncbi:MAG: hypothetical protein K2O14_02725 [Oscillospiraceae bacterium]|nr:hypothetical protein [Oscillospiraceae bacterium]